MAFREILKRMGVALGAALVSAPACALIVGPLDTNGSGGSTGTGAPTGAGASGGGATTGTASCAPPDAGAGCTPPRTIYSDPNTPYLSGLVLVGTDLYFGTASSRTVMRVGTDGSGVVSPGTSPYTTSLVATDGTSYVFWADDIAPQIQRMGLDGGGQFPIVDWTTLNGYGAHPTAMVVRGGYVYWAMKSPASVFRAPTDGSQQQDFWDAGTIAITQSPISPAYIPLSVAVDDQNVYWSDGKNIQRASLASIGSPDAGAPEAWVTEDAFPLLLAIDQDRLYWTETYAGAVQSKPKDTTTGLTKLTYSTIEAPTALYVDDTFVYWLNQDGSLRAALKDKLSPPVQIACASLAGMAGSAIVSDDGAVYWTTGGRPDCGIPGGLFQAPKPAH
jgi:hypothetical protein